MRYLFLLLFLFISLSSNAAVYLEVTLNDDSKVSGEFIEYYKDRWFYEEETSETDKYILLFKTKKGKADFSFTSIKDVAKIKKLKSKKSQYKSYLYKNNIIFKNEIVQNGDILTGNSGHHKFERMYGNFAWDIGILDKDKKQHSGLGLDLEDYHIFGAPVISPIHGKVVGKVSDQEDNIPSPNLIGDLSGKVNNYLTLKIHESFYLSVVHFMKDSITVNIGDQVQAGDKLGLVGNSGVSYVPHLHYTLYLYVPKVDRFISVPGYFSRKLK